MAVKGRLRFEILRRDGHTCRYCGQSAPDVKLTVDHVVPESLGGSDDPSNLVTACTSCNGGKASIAPDSALVADVASDALRYAAALRWAIEDRRQTFEALQSEIDYFHDKWTAWGAGEGEERVSVPLDIDWRSTVERWLVAGLDVDELVNRIPKAMKPKVRGDNFGRWRYFCGIAWNMLTELQDEARRVADLGGDELPAHVPVCADCGRDMRGESCYSCGFDDGRSFTEFRGHRGGYAVRVFDGLVPA